MAEVFKSPELHSFLYMLNPKDVVAPNSLRQLETIEVQHQEGYLSPTQLNIAQQQMQSDRKL